MQTLRIHTPRDAGDVREIVAASRASGERLEILGAARCRSYGRPVHADAVLDLAALSGVLLYEPAELVLSARAATPLAEIKQLLAENRQHLAFEPPDFGPLWGGAPGSGTIGGCLLLGLGGSRRSTGGAPRDHFLGLKGVNGFAQEFAAGGRVVKNVTGFDLPKLFAGSLGTLGILTEVTLKVMPAPQRSVTLAFVGLSVAQGLALLAVTASSPAQATGGAYLPESIVARSAVHVARAAGEPLTLLRLEGFAPSVEWSAQRIAELARPFSREPPLRFESEDAMQVWRETSSVSAFVDGTTAPVWRISCEPARAAAVIAEIETRSAAEWYLDAFGGLIWARLAESDDAGEAVIRGALARSVNSPGPARNAELGKGADVAQPAGHATLVRASAEVRGRVAPFTPMEPGLAALTRRVKQQFDPDGLFNPGRMYEGV